MRGRLPDLAICTEVSAAHPRGSNPRLSAGTDVTMFRLHALHLSYIDLTSTPSRHPKDSCTYVLFFGRLICSFCSIIALIFWPKSVRTGVQALK